MRNLKVLKNLKSSTGLPEAAVVAAVEGGEKIAPSRYLNIEIALNYFLGELPRYEEIKLQNVPVYNVEDIKDLEESQLVNLQTVTVEIPTADGDAILGGYFDGAQTQLLLLGTSDDDLSFVENSGLLLVMGYNGYFRMQAPLSLVVGNTLKVELTKIES